MRVLVMTTPRAGLHFLADLVDQCGCADDVLFMQAAHVGEIEGAFDHEVLLRRRDTLAQAVSWFVASQVKNWLGPGEGTPAYDYAGIRSGLERIRADNEMWVERLGNRGPTLYYEDVVDNTNLVETVVWPLGCEVPPGLVARTTITRTDVNDEFMARYREDDARA